MHLRSTDGGLDSSPRPLSFSREGDLIRPNLGLLLTPELDPETGLPDVINSLLCLNSED